MMRRNSNCIFYISFKVQNGWQQTVLTKTDQFGLYQDTQKDIMYDIVCVSFMGKNMNYAYKNTYARSTIQADLLGSNPLALACYRTHPALILNPFWDKPLSQTLSLRRRIIMLFMIQLQIHLCLNGEGVLWLLPLLWCGGCHLDPSPSFLPLQTLPPPPLPHCYPMCSVNRHNSSSHRYGIVDIS